jgi:hypothetical protein
MKVWIAGVLALVLATVLSLIDLGDKLPGWARAVVIGVVVVISVLSFPPIRSRLVGAVRPGAPRPLTTTFAGPIEDSEFTNIRTNADQVTNDKLTRTRWDKLTHRARSRWTR